MSRAVAWRQPLGLQPCLWGPAGRAPIAAEKPSPPLQGVVIIRRHLIIATDGRRRFPLSLAGIGAGARDTRTTCHIRPRLCTPRDSSLPISSKVGSSCSSLLLIVWSEHKGTQTDGGLMKWVEDGSGLSFPNKALYTSGANLDP
jgi:hypothetical protein